MGLYLRLCTELSPPPRGGASVVVGVALCPSKWIYGCDLIPEEARKQRKIWLVHQDRFLSRGIVFMDGLNSGCALQSDHF